MNRRDPWPTVVGGLMVVAMVVAGCEGQLHYESHPAGARDSVVATIVRRETRDSTGIERVKVGACWYVIVRGAPGVAIVHAGDCPNHYHGTSLNGAKIVSK